MPRTAIREFELANPLYANCRVSFYTVAGGVATAILATLYDSASAGNQLPNPQTLDSNGKFRQPVYIDVSVIGAVTGQSVPSHSTGIINPAPTFRVDPTTSKLQYSYDAGVSWNDSGQTIFKSRGAWLTATTYNNLDLVSQGGALYVALSTHVSGVFATDLAAGKWVAVLTLTASAIANVPAGGISSTDVQGAINELDTEKANIASPTFTGDPKAPTPAAGDNDTSIATTAFVQAAIVSLALGASQSLVELLHVNAQIGHRDLIQDAWFPAFFNQPWCGAPHYFEILDAAADTQYKVEGATSYLDDTGTLSPIGNAVGNFYVTQGFKVSQSFTPTAIWIKAYKTGNPVDSLEVQIWSDTAGSPNAALGAKGSLSGKLLNSDSTGQWYRVTGAFPALTAGTQYHLVADKSAGVDAVNYYNWKGKISAKAYPHGFCNLGTAVPAWTQFTTQAGNFFIENPAAQASLQAGGIYNDGKLQFFEGAAGVLNQSNGRVKDLKDFRQLDLTDFTMLIEGSTWTKGKPIADIMYGMDHDRISIQSNSGTGFPSINVYKADGSLVTVTGTVDCSAAGSQFIGVRIRAKNDGADVIDLWQGSGASMTKVATSGAISINFDTLFGLSRIGTFWLGGGFALAPVWTKDTAMTLLPSADGWTFTGTATEANAFSVSNGKLYQNAGGYTALQTGFYRKAALALSNANGWAVAAKLRVASSPNGKDSAIVEIDVSDGTKQWRVFNQEYYSESFAGGTGAMPQLDLKTAETVHHYIGKGSDVMRFVNGRLVDDSTGLMTSASANNQIDFGDNEAGSGNNADAVWDYNKYYNTAWLPPAFTSGALSELAIWTGDRSSLFNTLWNAGAPFSVKAVCGVQKNYVGEPFVHKVFLHGITTTATSADSAFPPVTLLPEMEGFTIGNLVTIAKAKVMYTNNIDQSAVYMGGAIDRDFSDRDGSAQTVSVNTGAINIAYEREKQTYFGPHKIQITFGANANTTTASSNRRSMVIEGRTVT